MAVPEGVASLVPLAVPEALPVAVAIPVPEAVEVQDFVAEAELVAEGVGKGCGARATPRNSVPFCAVIHTLSKNVFVLVLYRYRPHGLVTKRVCVSSSSARPTKRPSDPAKRGLPVSSVHAVGPPVYV